MKKTSSGFVGFHPDWKTRVKEEARGKICESPLMIACATGDIPSICSLFTTFWPFVDYFPEIIHGTLTKVPAEASPKLRTFLRRAAGPLSGTIHGMEQDERAHRAMWIAAAKVVGLDEKKLLQRSVLPEVDLISTTMETAEMEVKFLKFGAVEITAEEMSRFLYGAPPFVKVMGKKGMAWFGEHMVHPDGVTTHEDIAYKAAADIFRVKAIQPNEAEVAHLIQECVDQFISAAEACLSFEWLRRTGNEPKATQVARLIDPAVDKVITEAKHLTPDLGGDACTTQVGDAVAAPV